MDQTRVLTQKPGGLPAGLATVLNSPEDNRDSAYYSATDASSKHTSAASFGLGAGYGSSSDKTPSPIATTMLPHPAMVSPTSNMSVASMVSPSTPGSARFDRPSLEVNHNGVGPGMDSRRESVDSRINHSFGDMRLGNSPYTSQNHSTTSIHNSTSVAQQRLPRAGLETLAVHRISNGYQPNVERNPEAHTKAARTAPAITGPATSTIARAAEPTKGQAWAFPEEEIQRVPSNTFYDSRRSSVTESIASSQFTTESKLPPGQRRLEDADYPRGSGDFPAVHHHTLQHKAHSLSEEPNAQSGAQPYSRTPELRVSHKLAERKRRTEMKELFEQLRDLMPQERGSKASKWEILSKAITEHQKQDTTIRQLSAHCQSATSEIERLRREVQELSAQNAHLNAQVRQDVHPGGQGQPASGHAVPSQPPTDPYAAEQYRGQRPELPPLRSLSGSVPTNGPDSMTGVQYEPQRVNGFGRAERF